MKYFCCDEIRREKLKTSGTLNGIDFLEVLDDKSLLDDVRQRTLLVSFFFDSNLNSLNADNVRIEGGVRIRDVRVEWAFRGDVLPAGKLSAAEKQFLPAAAEDLKRLLVVRTDSNGDFSRYTLRIVKDSQDLDVSTPPDGFDAVLCAVDFSFKAGCPSDFDCLPRRVCPPQVASAPEIDYLAKDYASFRQLMLDRMASQMPEWQERSPADIGITLVEWLAYVADRLSYEQDAVATEAYLATARRRVSVKRHARLVDYFMHDGCNARTWVQVTVEGSGAVTLPEKTRFLTHFPGDEGRIATSAFSAAKALTERRTVFESMHEVSLFEDHNSLSFYAWGNERCCLPAGATRATLKKHLPNLKVGDVLVFVEKLDSRTGKAADADRAHRHAVMLTHVVAQEPGSPGQKLKDKLYDIEITEIEWAAEDALPFPFCISSITNDEHGSQSIGDASVALGNNVLADHGLRWEETAIKDGDQAEVPAAEKMRPSKKSQDRCSEAKARKKLPRFRPSLQERPLTFGAPYEKKLEFGFEPKTLLPDDLAADLTNHQLPAEFENAFILHKFVFDSDRLSVQGSEGEWSVSDGFLAVLVRRQGSRFDVYSAPSSASGIRRVKLASALPVILLKEESTGDDWGPARDLLEYEDDDRKFVVEQENDGTAVIRFGDDVYGSYPDSGVVFDAEYRVGNGSQGNIGAETLKHIVSNESHITSVVNPLPAVGGTDPETIETVRQKAPFAFRRQERAVTADDYAEVAKRYPGIQNAVAAFRWTGSWLTVFLTIDRKGGVSVDVKFRTAMKTHVEKYRLAGYDLVVDAPRLVSLEIEMLVCVKPGFFKEDVKEALLDFFSNSRLADGRLGIFHPDRFTFGQPVYLSRIYEAALSVDGVQSVQISKFQRQGVDASDAIQEGKIVLNRLEIARLDNDPNYPDHGVLRIQMGGGQ